MLRYHSERLRRAGDRSPLGRHRVGYITILPQSDPRSQAHKLTGLPIDLYTGLAVG